MRTTTQGFGAGDKDFTMQANVLRVLIGERSAATETAMVTVIEANIDDSTPQVLGYAMIRLISEAGALDVALTPIFMKKNRPASQLTTNHCESAPADAQDALTQVVFAGNHRRLGVRLVEAQRGWKSGGLKKQKQSLADECG